MVFGAPLYRTKRWAIAADVDGTWRLLGRWCWPGYCLLNAMSDAPAIPTFRSRKDARAAKARLTSYRSEARVVPIDMVLFSR